MTTILNQQKAFQSGKTYYFYLGTMAEFIKMMGVLKGFQDAGLNYKIALSGQHELRDSDLWKVIGRQKFDFVFFDRPVKKSIFHFGMWALTSFFTALSQLRKEFQVVNRKDVVWVVSGDTISTGLGALLGWVLGLKIAHVEGGLTSKRWLTPFPEEMTRVMSSRVAEIVFCQNQWCVDNLKSLNVKKVNTFQNTIVDSLEIALRLQPTNETVLSVHGQKYFVFSIHRQENIYNQRIFKFLVESVLAASSEYKCLFMMYDLTLIKVKQLGLWEALNSNPNIMLVPRMPYLQYMHLLRGSEFLISDGGSNQEDSYLLGLPCLILREVTERIEGLGENVVLSFNDAKLIGDFILNYKKYRRPPPKIDMSPSSIVVRELSSL